MGDRDRDRDALLRAADRERAPAPFADRRIAGGGFRAVATASSSSLQPMSVLAMWVGTVQKRWAMWDEKRDEARRVAQARRW